MQDGNGRCEITAKEICEKLNIPYSKLNHYTYLGFFSIVEKNGNKRIYNWEEVETRYRQITRLANEGYPLFLIRKKIAGEIANELL